MPETKDAACRPIIFAGESVRASLSGRKTQTRRVVKPQPDEMIYFGVKPTPYRFKTVRDMPGARFKDIIPCPYGVPGDLLWVRETFVTGHETDDYGDLIMADDDGEELPEKVWYRATEPDGFRWLDEDGGSTDRIPWKPSIHMPRWASRLTLRVESVRVERLQAISVGDAWKEGFYDTDGSGGWNPSIAVRWFHELWDTINANRGFPWESNPWVWVVTFSVESTAVRPS